MATATHARIVASGEFTTGPWTGEMAQIGMSIIGADGTSFLTPAINEALPTFTANPGGGSEVVAGLGTVDYGSFNANPGAWSKANQKAFASALQTYLGVIKAHQASDFRWSELRLSAIQADGHVINGATVVTLATPIAGTDATMDFPPQLSCVQSLVTGGRGSRNRGRWYVPLHSGSGTATGGLMLTATSTTLNTAAKALRTAIQAAPDLNVDMAVVSSTHQTYSSITQFRGGNHIDTQRRRSYGVPETYTTLTA